MTHVARTWRELEDKSKYQRLAKESKQNYETLKGKIKNPASDQQFNRVLRSLKNVSCN